MRNRNRPRCRRYGILDIGVRHCPLGGWSCPKYPSPPRLRQWDDCYYRLHGDCGFLEEVRMGSDTSHRGAMKAVPPPAVHTKLCVASSAHRHMRTPHDKTHAARDAGANARDHLEEGNTPREGQTPISTALGLQPASGNETTNDPTPLHARGAGGTHYL